MIRKILLYLQYAGLLLGFGCAHVHQSPQKTDQTAVVEFFLDTSVSLAVTANADVFAVDGAYLLPTEEQIRLMTAYCNRQRTKIYRPEIWDCDDIAKEYRVNAEKWALSSFGPKCPAGLAIAEAFVKVSGRIDGIGDYGAGGLHAMLLVKRCDGVWFVIEPGNGHRGRLDAAVYEGTLEVHTCIL